MSRFCCILPVTKTALLLALELYRGESNIPPLNKMTPLFRQLLVLNDDNHPQQYEIAQSLETLLQSKHFFAHHYFITSSLFVTDLT